MCTNTHLYVAYRYVLNYMFMNLLRTVVKIHRSALEIDCITLNQCSKFQQYIFKKESPLNDRYTKYLYSSFFFDHQ